LAPAPTRIAVNCELTIKIFLSVEDPIARNPNVTPPPTIVAFAPVVPRPNIQSPTLFVEGVAWIYAPIVLGSVELHRSVTKLPAPPPAVSVIVNESPTTVKDTPVCTCDGKKYGGPVAILCYPWLKKAGFLHK
jgi:hypothetical protein